MYTHALTLRTFSTVTFAMTLQTKSPAVLSRLLGVVYFLVKWSGSYPQQCYHIFKKNNTNRENVTAQYFLLRMNEWMWLSF